MPAYESEDAAGMDLVAALPAGEEVVLAPGSRALIPTGMAIELPKGFEAQIRPRSGLALKDGVTVLNSPGTIDADYRGEIGVILINFGDKPFVVRRGARIAQLVVSSVERVALIASERLTASVRGSNGFGSTGRSSEEVRMNLLSRRSVLAIAAVVDVALHSRSAPVAAKALAARHKLPPRHLETLLQGLVHAKILKGVRGPRGGYELARERRRITVGEIVRTAMSLSTADPDDLGANSMLLERVIDPAVRKAGETFLANLDAITVEEMCETAEQAHVLDDEKAAGDFAI